MEFPAAGLLAFDETEVDAFDGIDNGAEEEFVDDLAGGHGDAAFGTHVGGGLVGEMAAVGGEAPGEAGLEGAPGGGGGFFGVTARGIGEGGFGCGVGRGGGGGRGRWGGEGRSVEEAGGYSNHGDCYDIFSSF